ncbi:hypothetical protein SFRURICE_005592 [Spodoptera frugiperda]|nr:hypothetical protein SFRURICE_005592 [Spodoptera frugiperda]
MTQITGMTNSTRISMEENVTSDCSGESIRVARIAADNAARLIAAHTHPALLARAHVVSQWAHTMQSPAQGGARCAVSRCCGGRVASRAPLLPSRESRHCARAAPLALI